MLFIYHPLSYSLPVINNQTQLTASIKPCEITPVSVSLWGHLAVFSSLQAGLVARQTLESVSCSFLKCRPTYPYVLPGQPQSPQAKVYVHTGLIWLIVCSG